MNILSNEETNLNAFLSSFPKKFVFFFFLDIVIIYIKKKKTEVLF